MRIKKTSQYIEGGASLSNEYGTSNENGYTQEYINNLETYSTDEIRIGTWFGKPLYRKVINFGALGNNAETTISYDSTYMIQQFDVYVKNPNANIKFKLPIPGTNYISAFDYKASNRIAVQTTSDRTAFTDNYVILEYTKTTD